jgi:hypothetical protein
MNKIVLSFALVSSLILAPALAPVSANEYTTEQYQLIFQGEDQFQHKQAIESLMLAGLNDPIVYDVIETKFQASLGLATNKTAIDYSSWLAKALGYSGDEKYRLTLEQVVQGKYHKKLRKYAQEGLNSLTQYASWNQILADKTHYDSNQSQQLNSYANALASPDLALMRIAAKRIVNQRLYDSFLLDKLATELMQPRLLAHDRLAIDTYAWMAKALASSSQPQYQQLIQGLADNAPEKALRKYASKYIKTYYR